MVSGILIIASVTCVLNLANGFSEPFPGFKPCKSDDNACILQNTKDGIPTFVAGIQKFGIKSSDPDHYDRIDASTPNLQFILSDLTLTGLKTCKAINANRDESKLQITIVLQCSLKLEGNYELNGKVLFVDMKGSDKIHVELPNIINTITGNYIYKEGKDGNKYLRIKNFEHSYELKDKCTLVFDGLFPDNEILRNATNEVIKSHPNEVIMEIGEEVMKVVIKREVGYMNKFLSAIPYPQLALD